jgi:hypothetical protein
MDMWEVKNDKKPAGTIAHGSEGRVVRPSGKGVRVSTIYVLSEPSERLKGLPFNTWTSICARTTPVRRALCRPSLRRMPRTRTWSLYLCFPPLRVNFPRICLQASPSRTNGSRSVTQFLFATVELIPLPQSRRVAARQNATTRSEIVPHLERSKSSRKRWKRD